MAMLSVFSAAKEWEVLFLCFSHHQKIEYFWPNLRCSVDFLDSAFQAFQRLCQRFVPKHTDWSDLWTEPVSYTYKYVVWNRVNVCVLCIGLVWVLLFSTHNQTAPSKSVLVFFASGTVGIICNHQASYNLGIAFSFAYKHQQHPSSYQSHDIQSCLFLPL